jgi:hypothetical protein
VRLDTFMLADSVAAFNGQLYIHGGGITRINAPSLPWVQPQLAFVARIQVDPGEVIGPHLTVTTFLPNGEQDGDALTFALPDYPPPERTPGEETFIQAAVNPGNFLFEQEGVYRFELRVGDELLRDLHLPVVVDPATEVVDPAPE